MKSLALIALILGVSFAMPVVAAEIPTTKADCEEAEMVWREMALEKRCRSVRKLRLRYKVLGVIGLGSALLGVIILYREWHT